MKRFFFTLVLFLTVALAPPTWAAEPDLDSYGQQVVEFFEGLTNQFLSFFAPEPEPVELEAASTSEPTTDPDPLTGPDPEGGGATTNSGGGDPGSGGDPGAGTITYPGG